MSETLPSIVHHIDYFPLRIRVFRNGDMFDNGHVLAVTRKQFKHWIVFLDALTELLRTATAVRKLFSIQGIQVNHFDELESNGEYVAVENGNFINVPYGKTRFTMRGKRYNPIIRIPETIPTYLHSAESMDIYLKKEGYGTITGLPYPFDGILTRSPSASQLQFNHHMQSHIPPLKIGGSMEHLNELAGTATWLGKNEKWMMGERVTDDQTKKDERSDDNSSTDVAKSLNNNNNSKKLEESEGKKIPVTKLPRLMNSTRSSVKRDVARSFHPPPVSSAYSENLPPIENSTLTSKTELPKIVKKSPENDTISIKTEEECISIQKPEQTFSESTKVTSKVSRKGAKPEENDEVTYHRSYQVTETTIRRKEEENDEENKKKEREKEQQTIRNNKGEIGIKKERAKWSDTEKQPKNPIKEKPKPVRNANNIISTTTTTPKPRMANSKSNPQLNGKEKEKESGDYGEARKNNERSKFDMDINQIPKRTDYCNDEPSKIVTSRSSVHLFVDEIIGEEVDDVIERAQLWDRNRRRLNMRQVQTQTSITVRSSSYPRRHFELFDPDFD